MKEIKLSPMSEGVEKGLLILRNIIGPLEHGIPFKLIVDYDPEKERAEISVEIPEESLDRYNHAKEVYLQDLMKNPATPRIRL